MTDWKEASCLGILLASAFVPAVLVYRRRGDLFDPRIFFPLLYAYASAGPIVFKIAFTGEYHPGLKTHMLNAVLCSCATAVVGFNAGATFGLRNTGRRRRARRPQHALFTERDRLSNRYVRDLAVLGAAVTLGGFAAVSYELWSGASGYSKAYHLATASESITHWYYFFAAASTASVSLAVITGAHVSRSAFSPPILGLLGAHFAICSYSGERDALLVGALWCLSNWRRLSKPVVVSVAIAGVGWLGLSPLLRNAGAGIDVRLALLDEVGIEDVARSVTHFAPNVHVFTNVATDVPSTEPHWRGRSIVGSLLSFLPFEPAWAKETPTRWFREVYDHQRVAGYAFAQDAEAYLNFGWIGPPLWFAVWGYAMSVAYRNAIRADARLWTVFLWWHAVSVSAFGIRADSRGMLKSLIIGAVASKTLCFLGDLRAARRLRSAKRLAPPPAGRRANPAAARRTSRLAA
ncbi:O-antigen polymerase [Botrimarina sp.]|uniref:O-antigen polymerase n=1 Tax=Botrimarina sp. TaxID=2795802 RepID=UPI0032F0269C